MTNVVEAYDHDVNETKERLSISVDSSVAEHARQAVADGRATSISAWVTEAMRRHGEHEARLRAAGDFIAEYEADHGVITAADMVSAKRRFAERAVVVRGRS